MVSATPCDTDYRREAGAARDEARSRPPEDHQSMPPQIDHPDPTEAYGAPGAAAIIAIGASAGGLVALSAVLGALPATLACPVAVVQHLDPAHASHLAEILDRGTALEVREARQGEGLLPGVVVVAPPGHHMLVDEGGIVRLTDSERVRFVRPSVDVLLESVARSFGPRVLAVVLSGSGSDGAAGVSAVSAAGGTVLVQSPKTAQFPSMPAAAVATGHADHVLSLEELGPALLDLVGKG